MRILLSFLVYCSLAFNSNGIELSQVRDLYYQAAEKETASKKLVEKLATVNGQSAPIFLCYKGAAHMMEAKYAFNPITKLSKFKKGKSLIEAAIKKDNQHIEMRFIRFSIQTNLPKFLGVS